MKTLDYNQLLFLTDVVLFATAAHGEQKRKYSAAPYIVHPIRVAQKMIEHGADTGQIKAALLHDVVEDTPVTIDEIGYRFGKDVAELVGYLTDVSKPEDGNRTVRKAKDREHLASASPRAKSVKLADIIDNGHDITNNDPGFAKVYIKEIKSVLGVLKDADIQELVLEAEDMINKSEFKLKEYYRLKDEFKEEKKKAVEDAQKGLKEAKKTNDQEKIKLAKEKLSEAMEMKFHKNMRDILALERHIHEGIKEAENE